MYFNVANLETIDEKLKKNSRRFRKLLWDSRLKILGYYLVDEERRN